MPVRLVISDQVTFDFRFTLNDGGEDREFGFRASAKRHAIDDVLKDLRANGASEESMATWLRKRVDLRMVSWLGDSPLVDDETDAVIAAGDIALTALSSAVSNIGPMLLSRYTEAVSAKGKLGN